jgi:hypothetical protein
MGGGGLGPARFGSYRKRLGGASVSTVRQACSLLASEAVTAVTSCPPTTHHFLDMRKSVPIAGFFLGVGGRTEMIEFLTHMPVNTVIFVTVAVLSLAAILIALTRT